MIYTARVLPLACAGQILLTDNALRNAGNLTGADATVQIDDKTKLRADYA